jgi:N-acetylneuraminate synthase
MFGPDVCASVTTGELRQLVEGVRFIEKALANPIDKDTLAAEMTPMRKTFGKSLVARIDLPAGSILSEANLTAKKPGTGIPARHWHNLIGRRLRQTVAADQQITEDMIET